MNANPQDQNNMDFTVNEQADGTVQATPEVKANNTFGIVALILGILSIILACCCAWAGIILGIVTIVLAMVDKSKNGKFGTLAIIGLICGILAIIGGGANSLLGLIMGASGALGY